VASLPPILDRHPRVEEVLDAFAAALASDRTAYRGHVYRVFHFCRALGGVGATRDDAIALAAAFHDLGIWSDGTVDYLPPSVRRLREHLAERGKAPSQTSSPAWSSCTTSSRPAAARATR
jgi:hypothetical protein